MNAITSLWRALRASSLAAKRQPAATGMPTQQGAMHQRWLAVVALAAAGMLSGAAVQAQVVATTVAAAADLGRGQVVNVTVDWQRLANGVGDTVTVVIPPQLTVNPPAPPAGCTFTAPNLVCNVPDGAVGATGSIVFPVQGLTNGGFNLSATGTSPPTASFSGTVRATGDMIVGKVKTSPVGNPVTGAPVVFTLTPQITSGDDVPLGASVVVTENLPGTVADFSLTAVSASGLPRTCNTVASANATRKLICTFDGPFTRADLNASTIGVTGTPGNNGSFNNVVSIASGNNNYFDADPSNNVVTVPYIVNPGTDIRAAGIFPATPQAVGTSVPLTLTYTNDGPLPSPAGGTVQTIVPTTFTIGVLPANCTATPGQTLTVGVTPYAGTLITCTTLAVANGAQQDFVIPLTLPAAPEASSFPVVVTPPAGQGDANLGNNTHLLPYQIVEPFADLSLTKGKTPTGPRPTGTVVTTTLTVRNESNSTNPAVYDAAHPLRVVDYAFPAEVAGNAVSNVTAGWTCAVSTVPPAEALTYGGNAGRTTRIACENPGPGSLARNATTAVSFQTTIDTVTAPILLENRACTGATALTALGLTPANGPQPPEPAGQTGNDCRTAGDGLVATPVVSGEAVVDIKKESSVNNVNFFDPVASAPTLVGSANTLYWRMTITTPSVASNPLQKAIPTLRLTDNLPGIMNIAGAPSYVTPAIAVTTSPNTYGTCPNIGAGSGALTCDFTNVPPGTTITVDIPVQRSLIAGTLTNAGILTSPNAILTGTLNDAAAVIVNPRTDVQLTSKTVAPAVPRVGEVVTFTITAHNAGEAHITGPGQFTIKDDFNVGVPTLVTPAYEVLSVLPANPGAMSCAASNLAAGLVSCTNTGQVDRYETQTIAIKARIKKPAGLLVLPDGTLYSQVANTARVELDPSYCEFIAGGTCDDAASKANNSKEVKFDVQAPAIDLQQGKVRVLPAGQTAFLLGDPLRYRFSIRNAGPSRAEDIVMTDILTVPAGFQLELGANVPQNVNAATASAGYSLVPKAVTCTQAGPNQNVICKLDPAVANNFLDANQEVNFELALTMVGTSNVPAAFGNAAYVCADETNVYESSGKCSPDSAIAGNNLAAVNDVVFPKADLEVVEKKRVTPSPVAINQPVRYDIKLRNNGSAGTTKMRLVDTLPSGFEWVNSGLFAPKVTVDGGSAATLTAPGGALAASAAVPANGTDNVCFVSNGVTNVTLPTQSQQVTCDITGDFPPGAANTITLQLHMRAKSGVYDGSASAPYLANRTNTAEIFPGKDAAGVNVSVDDKPANNKQTEVVQVNNAQLAGRVFLDVNNNGDQNGQTLVTDQGLGGVVITLTGTDAFGNPVSRTTTTSSVAAGPGSLRGDYLFANLPPSNAAGYTITQTQPAIYDNGTPQPNTVRPVRNGTGNVGVAQNAAAYTVSNTPTTSVIAGVQLALGDVGAQFDFPEIYPAGGGGTQYLSGFVYLDTNSDGVKTPAKPGIAGVTVNLVGCFAGPDGVIDTVAPIGAGPAVCAGDDVPVALPAITDAAGYYQFALSGPGRFSVVQQAAQPLVGGVATVRGKTTAGSVDLITSAPGANDGGTRGTVNATGANAGGSAGVAQEISAAVTASQIRDVLINNSAAISVNNNFGEVLPASIAGVVYTEKGVANSNYQLGVDWAFTGVTVTLTGTDDLGNAVNVNTVTNGLGEYLFPGLRPGNYTVTKTNPVLVPAITNEPNGAYPGVDGATPFGVYVSPDVINGIALISGAKVVSTNFAVTNGPIPGPDLVVTKTTTQTIFTEGHTATYTVQVKNVGDQATDGTAYTVLDRLPNPGAPAKLTIASAAGVGWACTVAADQLSVSCQDTLVLAAKAVHPNTIQVVVNVGVGAAALAPLVNHVSVKGGGEQPPQEPQPPELAAPPVCLPAATNNVCKVETPVQVSSGISGNVWFDAGTQSKALDADDVLLPNWIVQVFDVTAGGSCTAAAVQGVPLQATTTDAVGYYQLLNLVPGNRYCVMFRNPADNAPFTGVVTNNNGAAPPAFSSVKDLPPFQVLEVVLPLPLPGEVIGAPQQSLPVDPTALPLNQGMLVLEKTGNKTYAEVGDTVLYTIRVRQVSGLPIAQATVRDRLPAGFTLVPGTVLVDSVRAADPLGGLGPVLAFNVGPMTNGKAITLSYRVRVGVGAQQGDGINRAKAHGCQTPAGCVNPGTLEPLAGSVASNEGIFKVRVGGGVFTAEACLMGKIFVDCNNNHIQDQEELGVPGVRLYFENGSYLISDSEGKYSQCGLQPRSHVLKVDSSTLPKGSRLTTSSNRNLGDANSLFIDLKNGELHRADFIEGSCTNPVLEQVKARRAQGEVRSVETESKQGPALRFESKPLSAPAQGTDSANQPIVQPRQGAGNAR